mgnify:FL=1|jgi:hypothetical protein|tara:strand:+ start:1373 stop:1909 length:537 start_codon:yes stop_codon:yes gene_type:complete
MAENYEEPRFEIIKQFKRFEIRNYSDAIQARVHTPGDGWANSSGGFRRIAGYIFGGNQRNQSIAMTAPVHMWKSEGGSMMAFIMPSEHEMNDLPMPNDPEIELLPVKGGVFAAMKFSGFSGHSKRDRLIAKLLRLVEKEGLTVAGEPILAVYDNPTSTLPFMRRNEILLPLGKNQDFS